MRVMLRKIYIIVLVPLICAFVSIFLPPVCKLRQTIKKSFFHVECSECARQEMPIIQFYRLLIDYASIKCTFHSIFAL